MRYAVRLLRPGNVKTRARAWSNLGQGGFTLLEVLVALAILGISVTIIFQLISANLKAVRGSEDYVSAVVRAQTKMREVLEDENLAEKVWSETTVDGYTVDIAVVETFKERTKELQVQLLEVVLTVHWIKDSKRKALTVRSMKMIHRKV
ncbi:MAG: prepilin-type N-terminal cleavage/methylation domain-containing protein [Syntrophobacterales bacterium]|jgi:general secretion pathway protein I|nr:prepilin-type N-terminal cleavage/methylation domain-containing protein [Syntrophobacterales bacterium]